MVGGANKVYGKKRFRLKSLILLFLLYTLVFGLDVQSINRQAYSSVVYMVKVEDFPEEMDGSLVRTWITEDRYPEGLLSEADYQRLWKACSLDKIPDRVKVSFGWTLRRTDMKMYPTDKPVSRKGSNIDYNQYTLLEPFTPLAVLHESGGWLYVHAPFMRGWVKKEDVYLSSKEELIKVISLPFLVVTAPEKEIGGLSWSMGSKLYYTRKDGDRYLILMPNMKKLWIEKDNDLHEGYLSFSEEIVKRLLVAYLGMPYSWGKLDCSAFVRNVFLVFGVELPRNSSQQMRVGNSYGCCFASYEQFKETLRSLPPYRTLIFMKGHVMVYGGFEKGQPVVYHAVHSIVHDDGIKRYVGKVVKNRLEEDSLRNLYSKVIDVRVLP